MIARLRMPDSHSTAGDSTPFTSFDELMGAVLLKLTLEHLRIDRRRLSDYLAWLLFVTPVSYVFFLSPVSDYIDQHDAGLLFGLGALVLSIIWRGLMGRLLFAWEAERSNARITAAAERLRLDAAALLDAERRTYDHYFPPGSVPQARPDYSARQHTSVVSQTLVAAALAQAGLSTRAQEWERTQKLCAALSGRAANWISVIIFLILCIAADISASIWPWLAGVILVWLLLLPLWPLQTEKKAFYYALLEALNRELHGHSWQAATPSRMG